MIFMAEEIVKCTRDCKAVLRRFYKKDCKFIEMKDVKILKGWFFYAIGGITTSCTLAPLKKFSRTSVIFDDKDFDDEGKKSFCRGYFNEIEEKNILKQLELDELGNLSPYLIKLSAPGSCFEEI